MIILRQSTYSFHSDGPGYIKIPGSDLILEKTEPWKFIKFLAKHFFKGLRKSHEAMLYYIVKNGTKEIGALELNEEPKEEINIVWIQINSDQRGQGYATKILEWCIKFVKDLGYKKLTLEVPGNSPDARHIYEKLGFTDVEYLGDDMIWGGLTRMEKNLIK